MPPRSGCSHGGQRSTRCPKNDGVLKERLVTAVTSFESRQLHRSSQSAPAARLHPGCRSGPRRKWAAPMRNSTPPQGSERKVAPMTVSRPNVIEIKLDRLIDDMRLLRSQMIAFDRHLNGIEAYLKSSEPSEQQPESKLRPWFAAAASTARTVLFAVGAATGAALLYLGT